MRELTRSRSGALIAALVGSTVATGVLQIVIPLKLRQLQASPAEIGLTLAMFGFGLFATEWLWGLLADRYGYGGPLAVSQLLYAVAILALANAGSVPVIAVCYLLASGAMVAAGPIARSYVGTALPSHLRATGLAILAAQWLVCQALGAGLGGWLLDRAGSRDILLGAAILPVVTAVLIAAVFRGYRGASHVDRPRDDERAEVARAGASVSRVLLVAAVIVLLIEVGAGGELALLPLLVTSHLGLSASTAGTAMLVAGVVGGALLIPGGRASDRWGRRPTMIVGGVISAIGFAIYAVAGTFTAVIAGALIRGLGASLVWPAATAWIAESMPRRQHALMMGLFGEFENFGLAIGPVLGGLAWSVAGIQGAFVVYAVAALMAAGVGALLIGRRPASESWPEMTSRVRQ